MTKKLDKKQKSERLMDMKRGDHLVSPRGIYTHHGIYLGEGQVIHYAGLARGFTADKVEIITIENFMAGNGASVQEHSERLFDHETAVDRALSRIGENEYRILSNNCEHFVSWCIQGEHRSLQVDKVKTVLRATGAVMQTSKNPTAAAVGQVVQRIAAERPAPKFENNIKSNRAKTCATNQQLEEIMADTSHYEKNYTDEGFWDKTVNYAKTAGRDVIEKSLWMYYAAQESQTPAWAKAAMYGAMGYFISPIDAIPDITPVIGYSDDLGVLAAAVAMTAANITDEVKSKASKTLENWFG